MSSSSPTPARKSTTKEMTDTETDDPGYRSRSQSRRSRRRKQAQKQQKPQQPPTIEEESQPPKSQAQSGAMQPFERIGPDETSMDGPVTYARSQRGEIPMRGGDAGQQLKTGPQGGGGEKSEMMDKDGLKLRLELNLDIEIELKASIRGDVTLALL